MGRMNLTVVSLNVAGCAMQVLLLVAVAGCSPLTILSATSPSSHFRSETDLSYGDADCQRLDVYVPKDAVGLRPTIVFFYGRGWRSGARGRYEFVASSLTRAGFVVVIPDYRRYPDNVFPAFVEDGAAAAAWVLDRLDRYGGDPEEVYLMGHSAGAHIAALLALNGQYLRRAGAAPSDIAGFIGLSGPYDFLPLEPGYLREVFPSSTREASQPVNFVSRNAPRTLLIHGLDDNVARPGNSRSLAARLSEARVPVTLKLYEGVGHGRIVAALAPRFGFLAETLADTVAFIEQVGNAPD